MTYYTALTTVWNSSIQPPTGVTGTAISSAMTTQAKLNCVNGWTVTISSYSLPALLTPSQILNTCVAADVAALTTSQMQLFQLCLSGGQVDASKGTNIRLGIQTIFSGKATTLANLGALVAPFDNPVVPWWQNNGYTRPFDLGDCSAAGVV